MKESCGRSSEWHPCRLGAIISWYPITRTGLGAGQLFCPWRLENLRLPVLVHDWCWRVFICCVYETEKTQLNSQRLGTSHCCPRTGNIMAACWDNGISLYSVSVLLLGWDGTQSFCLHNICHCRNHSGGWFAKGKTTEPENWVAEMCNVNLFLSVSP